MGSYCWGYVKMSSGTWGLPGGHLENGEKMREAAARELLEETGLSARNLIFASLVNQWDRTNHYVQVNFWAEDVMGEPQNVEPDYCEEWRWFEIGNLPEHIFIGHVEVIDLFKNSSDKFADA